MWRITGTVPLVLRLSLNPKIYETLKWYLFAIANEMAGVCVKLKASPTLDRHMQYMYISVVNLDTKWHKTRRYIIT